MGIKVVNESMGYNSFDNDFRGQVKILKPVFSGPKSKSQNDNVSVLIGKIIS